MLYVSKNIPFTDDAQELFDSAMPLLTPHDSGGSVPVNLILTIRTDTTNEVLMMPDNFYTVITDLPTDIPFDDISVLKMKEVAERYFDFKKFPENIFRTAFVTLGANLTSIGLFAHYCLVVDHKILSNPQFFKEGKLVPISYLQPEDFISKLTLKFLFQVKGGE